MKTVRRASLLTLVAVALIVTPQLCAQPADLSSAPLLGFEPAQVPLRAVDLNMSHADGDFATCQKATDGEDLLLDPVFEAIQNGPCAWCTTNSNCSTPCIDDNEQQSDCGDYGVCDPCKEGIVEIGRVAIGITAARKWLITCEYTTYWQVTKQSVNAGCQPFTVCATTKETTDVIGVPCCAHVPGCWGTSCTP